MTGQARNLNIKFGKHSSVSDFTATPGTLIQLAPEGTPGFMPAERMHLDRGATTAGARWLGAIAGPIDVSGSYGLDLIMRGMSGNAGGAVDAEAASEVGSVLDVLFGGDSTDPSGSGSTVAGGVGATPTLILVSGTNYSAGQAVLFPTTTATHAREIVSKATDMLTLDRDYSGTPTNGTVVYRAPYWVIDPSIIQHKHGYFDVEGEDWRRTYLACMGTGKLMFPTDNYVMLSTTWNANDISDSAEANPTYTEATAGNTLVAVNSYMYFGDTAYTFRDLQIDLGGKVTKREANNGAQGVHGYGVFEKKVKISGKLYLGDDTALGDIDDSSFTPLNMNIGQATDLAAGANKITLDWALQVGVSPGSAMYCRAPSFQFTKFQKTVVDGFDMVDFEGVALSPTTGSPFRLHLF